MSPLLRWRLRYPPAFAAVAVVTLALGIGVASALFSIVDGVLLRPLPYPGADRLVMLWESGPDAGMAEASVSFPTLLDFRRQAGSLEDLGGYQYMAYALTSVNQPERIWTVRLTPSVLGLLGVEPQLGRLPRPEEGRAGAEPVAVISHGLWQRRFGGDPAILGSTLRLDQGDHTVIGVMPPGFAFPPPVRKGDQTISLPAELWVPIVPGRTEEDRKMRVFFALGRLRPDVGIEQAQTEIEGVAARVAAAHPDSNGGWSARFVPLKEQVVRHVRSSLWFLLAAVGFVLVLMCSNVACLFFARMVGRRRELAVRSAMGAGRPRLAGLLLRESLLLGVAGGVGGLLVAHGLLAALAAVAPAEVPRLDEVGLDLRVLGFAAAVSLITAVAVGLVPALRMSRPALGRWLRNDVAAADGRRVRWRGRGLLITVELTLALALVVAVGLMARSFVQLTAVDPGFEPDRLLSFELQLPDGRYPDATDVVSFEARLAEGLAALPGVEEVGIVNFPPFIGYYVRLFVTVEDHPPPASPAERPMVQYRVISTRYLDVMSTPLVAGRGIEPGDDAAATRVALVNRTAARRFWPDADPIGRRLGLQPLAPMVRGGAPGGEVSYRVVGVVADTVRESLDELAEPMVYVPHSQDPWPLFSVVVRTAGPPEELIAPIRSRVAALDDTLALAAIRPMAERVHESTAQPRFVFSLLGGFSALAVALAAVGLYGVVFSLIGQRRRELGIRLALGGARRDVLRLLARNLGPYVAAGLVAGAAVAVALGRSLESLLYEVGALDPPTFVAAAALMALVAAAAAGWPAWKALRDDPFEVLRSP